MVVKGPSVVRGANARVGTKGAVLAEFALAATPLFITFFSLIQLGKVYTASFVVRHSAISAARAAAVIHKKGENNPGQNGTDEDITRAAQLAMGPWYGSTLDLNGNVKIIDKSSTSDPYGNVEVTVPAVYTCDVPLGSLLVCGAGRTKVMEAKATFPHQGAVYKE
jgi:Flp pilus assembly protein TadG